MKEIRGEIMSGNRKENNKKQCNRVKLGMLTSEIRGKIWCEIWCVKIRSVNRSEIGSEISSSNLGGRCRCNHVSHSLATSCSWLSSFYSLMSTLCEKSPLICMKAGVRRRGNWHHFA